jgi:molybdopterin synthase catalytic subunit
MIAITEDDFSLDELVRKAQRDDAGATVIFLGIVRDDGIEKMELEAFQEAALAELGRIADEATGRFNLTSLDIVHRVGSLSVGDNIVAIVCSAARRDEAFRGCRYVIEELKSRALIWKKEIGERGEQWAGNE